MTFFHSHWACLQHLLLLQVPAWILKVWTLPTPFWLTNNHTYKTATKLQAFPLAKGLEGVKFGLRVELSGRELSMHV
jgi:hypothetical protein